MTDSNYNYSLSDIASVANSDAFNGGGNSWFLIILFLLVFGGNGYGYGWNRNGNGEFGQYATAASQQEILFGQQFQNLDNKIDRLGNGIADATFSLNNSIKDGAYTTTNAVKDGVYTTTNAVKDGVCGVTNAVKDTAYATTNAVKDAAYATNNAVKDTAYATGVSIVNEGRALQNQLAQCCCDNKQATAQVRYDMANFAAQINSNIDNKFAALEKSQLEQQLANQASQINQLQMAQAVCGIPRISTYAWGTYPYTAPPTPTCGCGGCGCSNM